jgi:hypothetical protein
MPLPPQRSGSAIATHSGALAQASAKTLALPTIVTNDGYDKHTNWKSATSGISECDALIAQTGTVLGDESQTRADGRCRVCRRIMW